VMPHWHPERVDRVEPIADEEALEMTRRLAHEDGIFAGISTGANVVGAAPPRRQSRTRRRERDSRRRHRLQVHERRAIHRHVEARRRSRSRESTCQPSPTVARYDDPARDAPS
jgi:hypothetical protein